MLVILAVFSSSFYLQLRYFYTTARISSYFFVSTSIFSYRAAYINRCRQHEWMNELLSGGCIQQFTIELTKPLSHPHFCLRMSAPRVLTLSRSQRLWWLEKQNQSTHTWPLSWLARRVYLLTESCLRLLCMAASNKHTFSSSCCICWIDYLFVSKVKKKLLGWPNFHEPRFKCVA